MASVTEGRVYTCMHLRFQGLGSLAVFSGCVPVGYCSCGTAPLLDAHTFRDDFYRRLDIEDIDAHTCSTAEQHRQAYKNMHAPCTI